MRARACALVPVPSPTNPSNAEEGQYYAVVFACDVEITLLDVQRVAKWNQVCSLPATGTWGKINEGFGNGMRPRDATDMARTIPVFRIQFDHRVFNNAKKVAIA